MILAGTVLFAAQAFAHRPNERPAGNFTRGDGVIVSAVEHYEDGILGSDPVAVQFRLPDGTVIAETVFSTDSVWVRTTPVRVEVYRFPTIWIPVASSVQQFDGYVLTDMTTPRARRFSLFAHTWAHWRDYGKALGFAALLIIAGVATGAMPRRPSLVPVRVLAFVAIGFVSLLYALEVLFRGSVSPLILGILAGICFAAGFPLIRFLIRKRSG